MDNAFQLKHLILLAVFGAIILAGALFVDAASSDTIITFCDVGNGDSIYIRTRNGTDVLIDAGASQDILACLGTYMPVLDKNIELAMITHPHIDHYGGFVHILDRYTITTMIMNDYSAPAKTYKQLMKDLQEKYVSLVYPLGGEEYVIDTSAVIAILASGNSLRNVSNMNDLSIVALYKDVGTQIMLTGDATPHVLTNLAQSQSVELFADVLKVPHHGSEIGLIENFLNKVDPSYAVISVGAENSYGHPSDEILEMLEKHNVSILRTDQKGNIRMSIHPDGTFSL